MNKQNRNTKTKHAGMVPWKHTEANNVGMNHDKQKNMLGWPDMKNREGPMKNKTNTQTTKQHLRDGP